MVCLDEMPRPIRCLPADRAPGDEGDLLPVECHLEDRDDEDQPSKQVLVPDDGVIRLFEALGVGAPRWV